MRVVSENTEAEIKRRRAMHSVDWALRDLTANLLRVTRGAGSAYLIGRQAAALLQAMQEYWDAVGHYPDVHDMEQALSLRDADRESRIYDDHWEREHAERLMVKGALQMAASKLLGQRTQETAGHHELYTGLNMVEDQRQAERLKSARQRVAKRKRKAVREQARVELEELKREPVERVDQAARRTRRTKSRPGTRSHAKPLAPGETAWDRIEAIRRAKKKRRPKDAPGS